MIYLHHTPRSIFMFLLVMLSKGTCDATTLELNLVDSIKSQEQDRLSKDQKNEEVTNQSSDEKKEDPSGGKDLITWKVEADNPKKKEIVSEPKQETPHVLEEVSSNVRRSRTSTSNSQSNNPNNRNCWSSCNKHCGQRPGFRENLCCERTFRYCPGWICYCLYHYKIYHPNDSRIHQNEDGTFTRQEYICCCFQGICCPLISLCCAVPYLVNCMAHRRCSSCCRCFKNLEPCNNCSHRSSKNRKRIIDCNWLPIL